MIALLGPPTSNPWVRSSSKSGDFWRQLRGVPQTSITKHTTAKRGRLSSPICTPNVFTRCAALQRAAVISRRESVAGYADFARDSLSEHRTFRALVRGRQLR